MVSTKIMNQLRDAYEIAKNSKAPRLSNYSIILQKVLEDIFSTESFIAGIADTLLTRGEISSKKIKILKRPLLQGSCWEYVDGRSYDLIGIPEILEYAKGVEKIRILCVATINK